MEPVFVCPRCGYQGTQGFEDCPECGIVVEKFLSLRALGESSRLTQLSARDRRGGFPSSGVSRLLESDVGGAGSTGVILRTALLLMLTVWGASLILIPMSSSASGGTFIHLINLPFHEAGHVIFSPFGKFISSLGGTLGQLLVPLLCGATLLWKNSDPFGASICLWWFGENFVDIAPYINDARAGVLPLIGGNTGRNAPYGFHDWEYLLNETGLLGYDHQIATLSHALGTFLMIVAVGWAVLILFRHPLSGLLQARPR